MHASGGQISSDDGSTQGSISCDGSLRKGQFTSFSFQIDMDRGDSSLIVLYQVQTAGGNAGLRRQRLLRQRRRRTERPIAVRANNLHPLQTPTDCW
jgi:hypothetical protein